jgi:hypothetical protein
VSRKKSVAVELRLQNERVWIQNLSRFRPRHGFLIFLINLTYRNVDQFLGGLHVGGVNRFLGGPIAESARESPVDVPAAAGLQGTDIRHFFQERRQSTQGASFEVFRSIENHCAPFARICLSDH